MDILNVDLALSNDMKKWKRAKKNKRKSTKMKEEEGEPGFHFIAYVPIDGVVWKLDGLRLQPDNLGNLLLLTFFRNFLF
jgi:ubiquitin carboxyl-terminal hydrolase L5